MQAPWDLRQRGWKDAERHRERVHDAIRENLRHLIVEESIITSQGDRKVSVPVRYLTHYHFRYGESWEGVGVGSGEIGDVIGRKSDASAEDGTMGAGDQRGDAVYEAEVSLDTLTEIMLDELNLPRLQQSPHPDVPTDGWAFDDVRPRGIMPRLDKRRTLLENVKRRASQGNPTVGSIDDSDLRFRVWRQVQRPASRAAVYMLMDRSGSMGTEKRYIAKSFFFWLTRFLKLRYARVDLVFVAHDAEADIVSERDFFTISSSGGTRCSSAYRLALHHIKEHHPPPGWNSYVFHFTDGDNLPSDNAVCVPLIESLLDVCRMVGYGEIRYRSWGSFYQSAISETTGRTKPKMGPLFEAFSALEHDNLMLTYIDHRDEIYRALQSFLTREADEGRTEGVRA